MFVDVLWLFVVMYVCGGFLILCSARFASVFVVLCLGVWCLLYVVCCPFGIRLLLVLLLLCAGGRRFSGAV